MSSTKAVREIRNGQTQNGSANAKTDEASAKREPAEGRDARGRFVKGNFGGPGNPFGRTVAAFRAALVEAVTEKDITDIAYMLLFKAKSGDIAAAKLLLAYTVGKPAAAENSDRQDVEEYQLLREAVAKGEDVQASFEALPLDIANFMVKTRKFAQSVEQGERIVTEVDAGLAERAEQEAKKERKAAARRQREARLRGDGRDEEAPSTNGRIGRLPLELGNGHAARGGRHH